MYRAIQAAVALAVVEEAARGIQQAMDAWDTVNDSFCDESGNVVDTDGWSTRVVERDLAAWDHFTQILRYGAAFLFATRLPLNTDPQNTRLRHRRQELSRAYTSAHGTIRDITNTSDPLHPRRREEMAVEVWHEMTVWAEHAPAVIEAHRRASAARAHAKDTVKARGTAPLPPAAAPQRPALPPTRPSRRTP
ncbi:hypothetical protein ACFVVU_37455 [Kitasatospora sp. NPDC057965]|uniref:hypothetical protein n=1 Tax=Kitasatospora sp. NPDC057965 TaxID=3346291 RepID=UPI0036D94EC8